MAWVSVLLNPSGPNQQEGRQPEAASLGLRAPQTCHHRGGEELGGGPLGRGQFCRLGD